ncbi:uncharacterized protein BJX67DRAFT_348648 [Aspergillus lucknowensis]|uniref:Biotin-protein ligase N-terminal domain-containing protein n=1 Tax=Aspergillus lucknowensis TaxID=176173 RepID=A0ABR4LWX8_9EURO
MRATFLITTLLVGKVTFGQPATRPKALVYRGPAACDGCPEAVAALLKSSPSNFDVKFAGPQEEVDITATSLGGVQLYAQPGGGDLDPAWVGTKKYKNILRDFVARGGRYAGFCLGAFLAGSGPGFELLPLGSDTDEEITQPKAQVTNDSDTVIQVDWHFQTGSRKGHRQNGRWLYFQDGAVMKLARNTSAIVLGTYSSNGDVAASITPLGKGWVGLVGPHPEADESWCKSCLAPLSVHPEIQEYFFTF